ncbi:hypothetical protein [Agrococcus sp. ARC_14]|uniref:hypothetical protein n=1 Tax=Agrococcus sp. ARC_14 TaxID=2919927 RepID=UPI001F06CD69|nr:hypothetical protein [Agrococcus sp. ARC_14]MCH1883971.1 hypothetical protein [Agrococcus sp. ARC_14]
MHVQAPIPAPQFGAPVESRPRPDEYPTLEEARARALDLEWLTVLAHWSPTWLKSFHGPVVFGQLRRGHVPDSVADQWLPVARLWRDAGFTPELFLDLHREVRRQDGDRRAPRLRVRGTLEVEPWRTLPQQLQASTLSEAVTATLAWLLQE